MRALTLRVLADRLEHDEGPRRRLGWQVKREAKGSHKVLRREGFPDCVRAFHERDEIGPRMLARIAKGTGLRPEDL